MSRLSRVAALVTLAACSLGVAGCTFSLQGGPAPGGGLSGPTYNVTAVFGDVLNLPQRAQVKLDGVTVGQVTAVSARGFRAYVKMDIQRSIQLPPGTTAEVRFTTPLGENYVALQRPVKPGPGAALRDGGVLPESSTTSAATIEDTFAALSLVLNGGGLEQLRTIVGELNKALDGRGPVVKDLINQVSSLVSALNSRTDEIDRALAALASLTTELDQQGGVVATGLEKLAPAIQVLAGENADLRDLLTHLARLSDASTQVIARSRDALLADLNELAPIVDALVSIRGQLGPTLDDLQKFEALAGKATAGDYLHLYVTAIAQFCATGSTSGSSGCRDPGTAFAASGSSAATQLLQGGAR